MHPDEYWLRATVREYLNTIAMMKSGLYEGDEYQRLSADRTYWHDALILALGPAYDRPFDMAAYCRELLSRDGTQDDK